MDCRGCEGVTLDVDRGPINAPAGTERRGSVMGDIQPKGQISANDPKRDCHDLQVALPAGTRLPFPSLSTGQHFDIAYIGVYTHSFVPIPPLYSFPV